MSTNGKKSFAVRAVAVGYRNEDVIFHCPPVNACPLRRFATRSRVFMLRKIPIEIGGWYRMEIEYTVKNQQTIGVVSAVPAGELMDTRVVCNIAELKTTLDLTSHTAAGFWHANSNELVLVADIDQVITRSGCKPRPNDKLRAWCAPLLDAVTMKNTTQAQWKVTEVVPKDDQERPGYGRCAEGEPVARVRFEGGDPPVDEEDADHEDPFRRDPRDAVVPPMHSQSFWDKSAPRNVTSTQRREPVMPSIFAARRRAANGEPAPLRELNVSPGSSPQCSRTPANGANGAQVAGTRQASASNGASALPAAAKQDDDWDLQPLPAQSQPQRRIVRPSQTQETPRAPISSGSSPPPATANRAISATVSRDDDCNLKPLAPQPQRINGPAHSVRPAQAEEAPRTLPRAAAQCVEGSRSPPQNTQSAALPQRSSRITAGRSWQQHLGVAEETPVVEGEIIHLGDDEDDAPQQDAVQQPQHDWSAALADLLSVTHHSVEENVASSVNETLSSSIEEKDSTALSELIIDTSDPSAPAPVVVTPPPKEERRWEPVQRTGCVGVIWTKRSYQYLVYSPELEGREAFIQIFVHTRKMNVGQWLRFDATQWKPDARYTIGQYTPINEVMHAMPILDAIIITCDVHVTNNNNEEPPLVESDFFGHVEDPHSLAARLRSGVYSVNLMYSNEQKGAATGRWSLGFVNDEGA